MPWLNADQMEERCSSTRIAVQVSTFLSELESAAGVAAEGGPNSGPAVAKLLRAVAGIRDQVDRFSTERSGLQARAVYLQTSRSGRSAHCLSSLLCSQNLGTIVPTVSGLMAEVQHKSLLLFEPELCLCQPAADSILFAAAPWPSTNCFARGPKWCERFQVQADGGSEQRQSLTLQPAHADVRRGRCEAGGVAGGRECRAAAHGRGRAA